MFFAPESVTSISRQVKPVRRTEVEEGGELESFEPMLPRKIELLYSPEKNPGKKLMGYYVMNVKKLFFQIFYAPN